MKKHHTLISAIALSALALAGCSSNSETTSAPSPTATTPLDLGTYIPSTRDATPTAGSSNSSSGGTAASGKTQTPAAGSTAVPALASGKSVEFTDEELAKYQAGEYVPATEKHPAYNVPVPVMPAEAKEKTAEGAAAFLTYWADAMNYAMRTGDVELVRNATYQDSEYMVDYFGYFDAIENHYLDGGWVVGNEDKHDPIPTTYSVWSNTESSVIDSVSYSSAGKSFDKNGQQTEVLEAADYNGKQINITIHWEDASWQLENISGKLEG